MSEHPILFSSDMVNAILAGRKTQTRRVIRDQEHLLRMDRSDNYGPLTVHNSITPGIFRWECREGTGGGAGIQKCNYGFKGDYLWVRETFQLWKPWGSVGDEWIGDEVLEYDGRIPATAPDEYSPWRIAYKAADPDLCKWWRPSIFMRRWASRILLKIKDVRVERLQEITRDDAKAEGVDHLWHWTPDRDRKHFSRGALNPYIANFSVLWDQINSKRGYGWDVNPWVWAIEFELEESSNAGNVNH